MNNNWRDGCIFSKSEDLNDVKTLARQFTEEKIAPLASKIDENQEIPTSLIKEIANLGFLGAIVPEKYSGSNLSTECYVSIIEELSAGCASTGILVSAHNSLCAAPIVSFGTDIQKEQILPSIASGKSIGCFALSEPGSGSDAAAMVTTFQDKGDKVVINGVKNWITNGPISEYCILIARDEKVPGYKGISAFVHSLGLPGITVGKPEDKLGIRGSKTSSIFYDNVELKKQDSLLGPQGKGFNIAMETLNGGRISVASQAVGIARASLEAAIKYSKERKAFGVEICKHQSISNYLAEMITNVDAARYLTMGAAVAKDLGKPYIRQAAMAKLFASRVAREVSNLAIQIHGGNGYVRDYPVERYFRDAKITEIYEGTSEIQKLVISQKLLSE